MKSLGFIPVTGTDKPVGGYRRKSPTIFNTRKQALAAYPRYATGTREVFMGDE